MGRTDLVATLLLHEEDGMRGAVESGRRWRSLSFLTLVAKLVVSLLLVPPPGPARLVGENRRQVSRAKLFGEDRAADPFELSCGSSLPQSKKAELIIPVVVRGGLPAPITPRDDEVE